VKLLLDENLSPKLVAFLRSDYPGTTHVRTLALRGASDSMLWAYCRRAGYAIVSKDSDFRQRSFVLRSRTRIARFERDAEAALLVLRLCR